MKLKIILLLLWLPLGVFGQTKKISHLENIENQWITLANDWSYQKGDNLEWAKPEFDDSSWKTFSSRNLNMPDSTTVIAGDNEIVWFRKYIQIDSLVTTDFVIDIAQQGASEIYLDGKLIHKFGTVSSMPDEIINENPFGAFSSLKLENGKEHLLAVRYVNAQYKYPKNQRYTDTNGYIRLFLTSKSNANSERLFTATDSLVGNQWQYIGRYWRYQKGDNVNWAEADFDDSSWTQFSSYNLNKRDSKTIANKNEIVWFRKPIKADSLLSDALVLRTYQTGASEIYLDGVLIQKFGNISSNPDEFVAENPRQRVVSLPLFKNKEQVLAIRFQSSISKYPIYSNIFSGIYLKTNTLNNLLTNGPEITFKDEKEDRLINNLYTAFGIGLIMFILFLFLFIFFPKERINGYFALTNFFFCVLMGVLILDFNLVIFEFKIDYAIGFANSLYLLPSIYCIYKIFNQALGYIFWSFVVLCALDLIALFYISSNYLAPILGVLALFELLRVSFLNRKKEKVGATIFISAGILSLIYSVLLLLSTIEVVTISDIVYYMGYAFCLLPISIAIYLGYKFGIRSQTLRLQLEEIQVLSKEKESILAKQNETLEKQVKERTTSLNQSLENLKSTQSQLIQSEKMASLGELTAGIAHEIQNPLNFVNNFSEVSNELVDEMNQELDKGDIEEAKAISIDIKQNLEKITHHGKRADTIVKGMLAHSRSSSGEKVPTDINALADEYLRLSYHGLRARDKSFNADFKTDFDPDLPKVKVIPQDIGRVLLNLINNAFQACNEHSKNGEVGYNPTVSITTKLTANSQLLIAIQDNGMGIPESIKDKIFQPFFTTKPTGQGTGLGLSLSYDIVKAHGGELKVESEEGKGTEFKIKIPVS